MKKIIVFGSNGGLGKEICNLLKHHSITSINKTKLNFNKPKNKNKLFKLLKKLNPDVIINSAGFYRDNSLIKTSLDEFDNTFSINVRAPFVLSHEFAKDMIKKKWGRIVNIGSSSAYAGKPEHPAYAASKHALLGLSKSLTKDLRRFNVRVFFVSPGPVKTKMAARWAKSAKNQKYETFIEPKEFSTFVRDLIKADSNMFIEEVRICRMNEG